jgi:hypothetical protein
MDRCVIDGKAPILVTSSLYMKLQGDWSKEVYWPIETLSSLAILLLHLSVKKTTHKKPNVFRVSYREHGTRPQCPTATTLPMTFA